ncbi:MAG: hypothetical protein LKE46_03765 [Clostridium sp.]|uniref:hypothetical protein n=1 Tax=Clostridium sp. TaxID=1506 RepID=UPI0025C3E044|nr:hypothetical protein [Clostridium sp.]MCH3963366.1 hypothetical protein [Clostridium sp.]MCI1716766.1 hypothetical protein [Clostridium sp.]MCI1801050.1 hypothetical protein [Clostridium sp.]MCI1814952.1 hypothetical protein [Clostridium sp.]MCI1871853.1 hypothetical protein [Clostridium sp.]
MGFFSRSSDRRRYGDYKKGSNYYKREGFLRRLLSGFASFSRSYSDDSTRRRRRYYRSSRS